MGVHGALCIMAGEVKFADRHGTLGRESVVPAQALQSRTRAGVSKKIRDLCRSSCKRCWLVRILRHVNLEYVLREIQAFQLQGESVCKNEI